MVSVNRDMIIFIQIAQCREVEVLLARTPERPQIHLRPRTFQRYPKWCGRSTQAGNVQIAAAFRGLVDGGASDRAVCRILETSREDRLRSATGQKRRRFIDAFV